MPIIINDGDIMEVLQETPIQSNMISQVKAREYRVSFSFDSGEELSYTQQEDANSIYDDYTYLLVAAYSCDRIEAYYTTGSFQVPFVNVSPSNVHWVINGNRVGSPEGLANYVGPYTDLTGPDSQIGNFSDYDGTSSTFEQTGLWNDGYVDFFNVRIKDNSNITISTSGNVSTISYKILTKLCAVSRRRNEYSGYIYDGSTIKFTVNNRVVSLEDAGIISVGQQTDNILALDDNPLFTTSTIYNGISAAAENCMTLRKQWKNGKDSCKILVGCGEYYNEDGSLAISSKETNLPMLFNVGDIVIPYIKIASQYTEDDETYISSEECGILTYSNGSSKRFVVVDEKYIDDGVCSQELTLVETDFAKEIVLTNDSSTNITVTRISSNVQGAKIGVIDDLVVYIGDVIQIDVVKDYSDDYLVFTVNGEAKTSGVQLTVTDTIYVVAKVKELNDFTWAEIAEISENGQAQDFFNVGDTKVLKYSGGNTVPYYITFTIVGFNHDDLSDGTGKAGITFAMDNLLEAMDFANGGGYIWTNSTLRTELATIYTKLQNNIYDNTLPTYIKQVKKKYLNLDGQSPITQSSNEYIWLYSTIEIDGVELNISEQEGQQYEYWQSIKDGSIASNRIKAYQDGLERTNVVAKYPTRTALYDSWSNAYMYYYIDTDGMKKYNRNTQQCHLYFGFCI